MGGIDCGIQLMKIYFQNNRFLNHWINYTAKFAICIGFGYYIRLGIIILKDNSIDIQFFYWRLFMLREKKQ
jgi:hypothetical protein